MLPELKGYEGVKYGNGEKFNNQVSYPVIDRDAYP